MFDFETKTKDAIRYKLIIYTYITSTDYTPKEDDIIKRASCMVSVIFIIIIIMIRFLN